MKKKEAFLKDDNIIKLDITSKYNPLLDTDILFYNNDIGTAVLNFLICKNDIPFEISENNAKASITLKTEDYSIETGAYISDDLKFIDPINGLLSYDIPDYFLKYTGKVEGQIYFGQNGSNNIIITRKFTFSIEDDNISDFEATTKVTYIKTLNDIIAEFNREIVGYKESLGQLPTLLEGIESKFDDATRKINAKGAEIQLRIQTLSTKKESFIKSQYDELVNNINTFKQDIQNYLQEAKQNAENLNVITQDEVSNFQKSKLTNDEGLAEEYEEVSIQSILQSTSTTKIIHIKNASYAPSIKSTINEESVEINSEPKINTDVVTEKEFIENEPEEIPQSIQNSDLNRKSGLLVIFKTRTDGRAFWYPDNTNETYTCFSKEGVWTGWYQINDESITKDYIKNLIEMESNNNIAYTDNKFEDLQWQKHKVTEINGTAITVDLDYAQSNLIELKTGNYYALNIPNLPTDMKVTQGYLRVSVKDDNNKLFEFTPKGTNNTLINNLENDILTDWTLPNDNKKSVLFDGAENGVGSEIILADDYTKYDLLFISGTYPGGLIETFTNTSMNGSIQVSKTNILDLQGNAGGDYECILTKINSKTLKIENDVFYDNGERQASGANANRVTINKIVGWS